MNKAAHTYAGFWDGVLVSFGAVLSFPHGQIKHGWRESRVVVLPDFQGLGIGTRFSEVLASSYVAAGGRYFSRTAHPRMGQHRDGSSLWRATSSNRRVLKQGNLTRVLEGGPEHYNAWTHDERRLCWSHEYVGNA